MPVSTHQLKFSTRGDTEVVDLTAEVEQAVRQSGLSEGAAVVFVPGSTAGVTTVEYERGMVADLKAVMERLIPTGDRYAHNHGGDSNGHAHVRAAIVGPSVIVPVSGGRLALGTWQQIVLVDFDDRPRSRTVLVQLVG